MIEPLWLHREDPAEYVRARTELLRHSDDPPFESLRDALVEAGIDAQRSVLADYFPDGGSDFGLLITPDGHEMMLHVAWGTHDVRLEPVPARRAHGYALEMYLGWLLWNEEMSEEPRDATRSLIPLVRFMTELFRSDEDGHLGWVSRLRREARPLAGMSRDPADAAMVPGIAPSKVSPGASRYGFVFPDGAAFVVRPRSEPARVEEVPSAQLEFVFGPLHPAALAYLNGD
jgi:hypothetical protein